MDGIKACSCEKICPKIVGNLVQMVSITSCGGKRYHIHKTSWSDNKSVPAHGKRGNQNTYCYFPGLQLLKGPDAIITLEWGGGGSRGTEDVRSWGGWQGDRFQGGTVEGRASGATTKTPSCL